MLVKPFLVSGPISMASSSSAQTTNLLEIQQVKSEGFRQFQVERKNFCSLSLLNSFLTYTASKCISLTTDECSAYQPMLPYIKLTEKN